MNLGYESANKCSRSVDVMKGYKKLATHQFENE